jgi:hypothetical protein
VASIPAAPVVGFGKEVKGARRCSRRGEGRRGGGGKERAAMALGAFKAARQGSRGGGPVRGARWMRQRGSGSEAHGRGGGPTGGRTRSW